MDVFLGRVRVIAIDCTGFKFDEEGDFVDLVDESESVSKTSLKNLKELILDECTGILDAIPPEFIAETFPAVETVTLRDVIFPDEPDRILAFLLAFKSLKRVNVYDARIPQEVLAKLYEERECDIIGCILPDDDDTAVDVEAEIGEEIARYLDDQK